jgi:hypothetical protein
MKYQVIVKNNIVKEYPYRMQAVVWCFMHGYGYAGKGYRWISGAEIREVEK